jgi:hypothetical protein
MVRRVLQIPLAALVIALLWTSTAWATPAGQVPQLGVRGSWGGNAIGFGEVRPATIFNGGSYTGEVKGIRWSSWGLPHAEGVGSACFLGPGQPTYQCTWQRATVVAFKLGSCSGQRAYRAVEWFFPGHGEQFDPLSYETTCQAGTVFGPAPCTKAAAQVGIQASDPTFTARHLACSGGLAIVGGVDRQGFTVAMLTDNKLGSWNLYDNYISDGTCVLAISQPRCRNGDQPPLPRSYATIVSLVTKAGLRVSANGMDILPPQGFPW